MNRNQSVHKIYSSTKQVDQAATASFAHATPFGHGKSNKKFAKG